ncbi:MAG: aspartyl protease family protein [Phycisphaerae bacterium]
MRLKLLAACLLFPIAAQAQLDSPPPDGRPERTELGAPQRVPFSLDRGKIVVEARVNGRGPFPFVLDTGAGANILNQDLADELGLETTGKTKVGDPTNPESISATIVRLDSIQLGDARFEGLRALAWDRGALYGGANAPRGILGYPLFAKCLLTLDYGAQRIELTRGELPKADGVGVIDYRIEHGGIPTFEIKIAGQRVPAHLDSGAMSGLSVPNEWEPRFPVSGPVAVVGRARTASKEYGIRGATLDGALEIGGQRLDAPEIRFSGALRTANIGTELLRLFRVTLDSANQRVRFERVAPGATTAPVASKPRLGVTLERRQETTGTTIVVHDVVAETPAARAGIKPGDIVLRIAGRPAAEVEGDVLRQELGKAESIEFELRRGTETLKIKVDLRPSPKSQP